MKKTQQQKPVKAKPQRRRRTKSTVPSYLQGELRDLPPAKSVAESQAEREAFFARAWAQKGAREAREAQNAKNLQKTAQARELDKQGDSGELAGQKKIAEEQRLARAQRIAQALSSE